MKPATSWADEDDEGEGKKTNMEMSSRLRGHAAQKVTLAHSREHVPCRSTQGRLHRRPPLPHRTTGPSGRMSASRTILRLPGRRLPPREGSLRTSFSSGTSPTK